MAQLPLTIASLRGGLNEHAPAIIGDDQCTAAENVEWVLTPLGERRLGSAAVSVAGSALANANWIVWLHRHLPSSDQTQAQLWAVGIIYHGGGPHELVMAYNDPTGWHDVTFPDPPVTNGFSEYHIQGLSLHGKLFLAYHSDVDRLHVAKIGASGFMEVRRAGLVGPPTTVTTADETPPGPMTLPRWYRVRYAQSQPSGLWLLAEPTDAVKHTPPPATTEPAFAGGTTGIRVTRTVDPLDIDAGEPASTHWRLEASMNGVDFYEVLSFDMSVTTYLDTTPDSGYATTEVSPDVGDYEPVPSVRFLAADDDRLMGGGSFMNSDVGSRVMWTPTWGAPGYANDERLSLDTNPYLDLDNYEGGDLTNLSNTVNGYLYVTKWRHIYQLTRTGVPTRAYEAIPLTKQRGAIPHSLVEGFDQGGKPFCFILDPDVGPCQIGGAEGIEPCGGDLLVKTWPTINVDAIVPAAALYFPEKRQVHWWIATGTSQSPNLRLVLHTNLMRKSPEGTTGGFAIWTGIGSSIVSACLFADNIASGGPRTRKLKPFMGVARNTADYPHIIRGDTGHNDATFEYRARLKTKAIVRSGLLSHFECGEAQLMTSASLARIDVTVIGMRSDHSIVRKTVTGIPLADFEREGEHIIQSLDNLSLAELQTIQVEIADSADLAVAEGQWHLELMTLSLTGGLQARG